MFRMQAIRMMALAATVSMFGVVSASAEHKGEHNTSQFQGPKANTGKAIHYHEGAKNMLKVSDDFQVPDTPAPTWRVVDSKGMIYTLDAFKIKGGEKRMVVIPAYVPNVAKVQVYCAFAEVLLGESSFTSAVK